MEKLKANIDKAIQEADSIWKFFDLLKANIVVGEETPQMQIEYRMACQLSMTLRYWVQRRKRIVYEVKEILRQAERELEFFALSYSTDSLHVSSDDFNRQKQLCLADEESVRIVNYVIEYENMERVYDKLNSLLNKELKAEEAEDELVNG